MTLRPGTFRNQLMLAVLGFVLLAELLLIGAMLQRTYEQRVDQARESLQVADRVLNQVMSARADQLLSTVSTLSSDFGFKSAVATQDGPTQRTTLRNFGDRANADLVMLSEPSGELRMLVPEMASEVSTTPFRHVLTDARRSGSATGLVMVDKRPFQFVAAPVNAPRLIAWIGMGFSINATVAQTLAGLTGVNVEFYVQVDDRKVYRTGARTPDEVPADASQNSAFMTNAHVLFKSEDAELYVTLSLSRASVLGPFYDLASNLAIVLLISIALSVMVAIGLARRLSQPVRDLSEFAESVAAGQYLETPRAQGIGEFDVLTRSLSAMQNAVRERETRIRHQATHDALTGLLNRNAVRDLLQTELDNAQSLALVRIAIHDFSRMNSALGYRLGDAVLQTVSERLKGVCEHAHTLGRIEGNDFLLLLDCRDGDAALRQTLDAMRSDVERTVQLEHTSIRLRLEIGVVRVPEDATDIEAAWRRTAITREASRHARCETVFYASGMDEAHQRELLIIQGLAPGLERGELSLVYQPKMSLANADIGCVEALARWIHPRLGPVAPDEFILLAERSNQIRLLTNWAVGQITRDLAFWKDAGIKLGVAINLSADEIAQPELDAILAPLFEIADAEHPITLEVTESALLREPETALANLRSLQQRGARISVDDFGTGYSSLAQLKQLAPDELKIDKSFVFKLAETQADQFIVDLIIDLGHKLGLEVVAEGIENAPSWRYLSDKGADLMQGYYLAKPMPAGDLVAWCADHAANRSRWLERAPSRNTGNE